MTQSADATRRARPETPVMWICGGFVIALVAGAMAALGATVDEGGWVIYLLACAVGVIGWVLLAAGTIALGVRLGARWVDYERQR